MNRSRFGGNARAPRPSLNSIAATQRMCGTSADKRFAPLPRLRYNTIECGSYRGSKIIWAQSVSSAIRGAALNATLFYKTGVVRFPPIHRHFKNRIKHVVNFVTQFVFGAIKTVIGCISSSVSVLVYLRNGHRQPNGEEFKDQRNIRVLQSTIEMLKKQLIKKDEEINVLKDSNVNLTEKTVPNLLNKIEIRNSVINDYRRDDDEGAIDTIIELHNKLNMHKKHIAKLQNGKEAMYEQIKDLFRSLEKKEIQLSKSRQQVLDFSHQVMQLTGQIKQRDDIITAIKNSNSNDNIKITIKLGAGSVERTTPRSILERTSPSSSSRLPECSFPNQNNSDTSEISSRPSEQRISDVKEHLKSQRPMIDSLKKRVALINGEKSGTSTSEVMMSR